jgi:hypothetical protein
MAEGSRHQTLVDRFQTDLRALPLQEVVRKHITTGMPVEIGEDDYYSLRSLVAEHFQLHPSAVLLIGSCRQGFSIAPKKRYRPARELSDLDIAVVSSVRFESYWDAVFTYSDADRAWQRSRQYRIFAWTLFRGWIDPRGLPNVSTFKEAADWTDFFDSLMQSRKFGCRRISARLYRSWSRLDAYQERAVRQCLNSLGVTRNA